MPRIPKNGIKAQTPAQRKKDQLSRRLQRLKTTDPANWTLHDCLYSLHSPRTRDELLIPAITQICELHDYTVTITPKDQPLPKPVKVTEPKAQPDYSLQANGQCQAARSNRTRCQTPATTTAVLTMNNGKPGKFAICENHTAKLNKKAVVTPCTACYPNKKPRKAKEGITA